MANYLMRYPNGKAKALTLSYDDGVYSDIRFIETIDRYGLKATFNLNGGCFLSEDEVTDSPTRRLTKKEAIALYTNCGHEIACHGYTHKHATDLPRDAVAYEFLKDREVLENMFGRVIRGMAYAYGNHSDEVIDTVRATGIVYGRTTVSTHNFSLPKEWLALPATCHHRDAALMELAEQFATLAIRPFDTVRLFYVWGHTYEFVHADNWDVIEHFGEYIGNRDDIWYATNIEIYEYIEAYKSLVCSADMTRVYNPTATALWITSDAGKLYTVAPGETVALNG